MSIWVGADPGGRRKFGLSLLDADGLARCCTVSSVDEAVDWIMDQVDADVVGGIGIDAPLWWSSGRGGGRLADKWIRGRYNIASGTVQSVNSLRGAAIAQAQLLVDRMRERLTGLKVTETHPKALLIAMGIDFECLCARYEVVVPPVNEHERDAVIGAIAAREGFENRWGVDLSRDRWASEQDPDDYWIAPIRYFWPND